MSNIGRLLRYDWPLHFVLLLTNWLPDNVQILRLRGFLARPFFRKCGKNLRLGRNITFYNPVNITIGSNVYIALGNWFMAAESITIGDQALFGPYNVIVTSNHTMHDGSFRYGKPVKGPIHIGNGAWVGASCTILKGITVGNGSAVGANSVVVKDVPPFTVVGGNPAKELKKLNQPEQIEE
ncbi:MAG: acyltransferase [Cyclobacteriaceae bacterium]